MVFENARFFGGFFYEITRKIFFSIGRVHFFVALSFDFYLYVIRILHCITECQLGKCDIF